MAPGPSGNHLTIRILAISAISRQPTGRLSAHTGRAEDKAPQATGPE